MIANKKLFLNAEQILAIEDAYRYQIQRGFVIPDCDFDDIQALNADDFTKTVTKMLETVKNIRNIRGLIQEWVEIALTYKKDQFHISDFSGSTPTGNIPFYDWLNARTEDEDMPY